MGTRSGVLLAGACILLGGCGEECENGFKIKTEYRTIFWEDSWNENSKDTIVDGAVRTSTWTYKSGRSLSLRCFQNSDREFSGFDIRYSIDAPLLKQLAPELQKAGPVKLLVNVDGSNVASIEARVVAQDDGIDFLSSSVPPALIEQLSSARKDIVVMPRQKEKNLDAVLEFGVAKLRENLEPVKKACAHLRTKPEDPSRADEPQKAENSPRRTG